MLLVLYGTCDSVVIIFSNAPTYIVFSGRKVLETRSFSDDSRISQLEEELKEAKWIAEDADRKYDEVLISMLS